ncbi:copper resistance protein B [Cognatilysobacter tabacisoli]|uniref:copper resistance protein B n=1 Tax=Cognatilysobacter tabacisoli TaxID=2315424 RepID=UPI000E6AE971|nr:copper resistance protein B [Lysobacter tabacisoli]
MSARTPLFLALLIAAAPVAAQHQGHAQPTTTPPAAATEQQSESVDHSKMDHSTMDHSKVDHSTMDHSKVDHSTMDHSKMDHGASQPSAPGPSIPPITPEMRAAAFPDLGGMHHMDGHMDDNPFNVYVGLDQIEWQDSDDGAVFAWDAKAWLGRDTGKLWLRAEGERSDGRTEHANAHVLWGKPLAPWWDLVAGVRHDFAPGDGQTWAAIGVQGLAPYKFEVEATGYVGEGGRTAATIEAEYELLLTNRLILQPQVEAELSGKDDPERHVGSGLSEVTAGVRLRYEVRREFAPYVGVEWSRKFGATADYARDDGEGVEDTRLVAGVRIWF